MERMEIIRDLRSGEFDVLVGINLLREGLDIPDNFVWKKEKDSFVKSKPTFKGITDNIPKKAKVESKAFDYDEENVKKNRAFLEEIKDKNSPYHNFKIDKALFEKIIYADIKDLLSIVRQYGNFCLHYAPERIHLYIDYDEETNTYSIEEANLNEKEKQIFVNTSTDKQLQKEILKQLEDQAESLAGTAVYAGAKVVADKVKRQIDHIDTGNAWDANYSDYEYDRRERQKEGLRKSMGISAMRNDNGFLNVKVGFDGYNDIKTRKYPNGQPNAMVARIFNSGTSYNRKQPFFKNAIAESKLVAENAMAIAVDEKILAIYENQKGGKE